MIKSLILLIGLICTALASFSQSGEQVLRLLNDTLKKDPHNSEILFGRGMTYLELKKYNDAITDFTKALQYLKLNSPPASRDDKPTDSVDILMNRAYCYDQINAIEDAVSDYRYLQAHRPNNFMYSIAVARMYIRNKEFEKAQIEINRLKAFQDNERGLVYQAIYYYEIEKYNEALKAVDIALTKYPGSIEGLITRAKIFGKLSRTEEACNSVNEAKEKITIEYFGGERGFKRDFEGYIQDLKKIYCK